MQTADILSVGALLAATTYMVVALRQIFRTPKTLTVTRKDTGKTVVLDTQAGRQEGRKLAALL